MRKVNYLTLGLFLLTARAEKDFQGYLTEQTKGTTVTKDLLLKKENTTGHGTTESAYRHAAVAVTAEIPEVVFSATRPAPPLERIQRTNTPTVKERFVLRKRHKSLIPQKGNPTATSVYTKSEMPLISNYEKIAFSSAQAAFESMMNDTSESGVNLSTEAVKSSLRRRTLHDNRSQRGTDSIPLTSADRGLRVPVLSASHPHVIDNLAVLPHDNDDKQAQGKDEKESSTLERNKYPSGTMQSIIQKPAISPSVSTDSLGTGIALDFNEFTTSLENLPDTSARKQEQILRFSSPSFNKTIKSNQSILTNSQIKSPLSDAETEASETQSLGETPSVARKDSEKQLRLIHAGEFSVTENPISANTRKPVTSREQETFEKKGSTGSLRLKLHPSLSTNFQNVFVLHRALDVSSGSASNTPVITEAALSTQKSVFQKGSDHRAASHQTARMRLIEAHRTVVPFSFGKPTTSAVRNPESHSLTARAASLMSVVRSQTPAKPRPQTKELVLTLLPKDSAIKFTSAATKAHDPHIFNTLNSIIQQSIVYPPGPANKPVMKEQQIPTFATRKTDVPVTRLSDSRQESDDVLPTLTPTPPLSKPSSGRLTTNRFFGTRSKITQKKTSDMTTHLSFTRYNMDLRRESQMVHNLKLGDKSEQVQNVAAEDHKDIIVTGGKQSEEMKASEETQKLQNEEEGKGNNMSEDKTEELFKSDETERANKGGMITNVVEVNKKTGREGQKTTERDTETSRENSGDIDAKENTENRTKDAAANRRDFLMAERGEETARDKVLIHNREIGREDVTNVPPGATADSKELNRDTGHTVINSPSCHGLIKRSEATEQKGVYLAEKTTQNVEMKNKTLSHQVTINHRQLHSALRSTSPKRSSMTSLPEEPCTQMKPRPSPRGAMITKRADKSSLTEARAQSKDSETTSSATAVQTMVPKHTSGVPALKFRDASKPTLSPHSSSTKSAHPVLNSIGNVMSLTTPRLAVTAGFLSAQPRITANIPTLALSIIHSISNHRHKLTASVSNSDSLLQTTNDRQRAKHIKPAHIFQSRVKAPLTSNLGYGVNISSSVNPAPPQQMYSDSSTRPLTAETLSSGAHVSIGRLHSYQGQSVGQISRSSSSSSDMTSGQKCSFQLSVQTAHSEALHPPADDNRQRSVQTLMATMSPKAKNDQLSLSSASTLLNPMLLRGDSLPGTYSLTAITRSGAEKEIFRRSEDQYAHNESGHAESLLGTAEETSRTGENDSGQSVMTSAVTHSDAVTESRDEITSYRFIAQTAGRRERYASSIEEFNSISQTEKLAVENAEVNEHDSLFNTHQNNDAIKAVTSTLDNNHPSHAEASNETGTKPIMPAVQTTQTEQAIPENFQLVTNDFALLVLDRNDRTGTAALTESDYLVPEMEAGKQNGPAASQGSGSDNAVAVPLISFRSDLKFSNKSTRHTGDQILDTTSEFQISTTKNNDFVSPAARIKAPVSREARESVLTTSANTQVVTETSFQVAHAERRLQINSQIESLPLREPSATPTPGKHAPAMERKNAPETQPGHEISVQATVQSQHAPLGMKATAHAVTHPVHHFKGVRTPSTNPQLSKPSSDYTVPAKATPRAVGVSYAVLSLATSTSDHDHAAVDEHMTKNASNMTDKTSTKTQRALLEMDHLERRVVPDQARTVLEAGQRRSHREADDAAEDVLARPEVATTQTTIKSTEWTLLTGTNAKTQLNVGAAELDTFEAQNATRSVDAAAKGETTVQESGRRLVVLEPGSEPEVVVLKHRRRTPSHLYLSGVTEVSEDLCGSGNYTAEMSLNLGRDVEPGDAVPVLGNLRVVINLKTNNSLMNLEVTSCCLSPTVQPDLTNSTCCLFSRLAAEPVGITLLPSALSTSASFTISLFQMINYSVVYLHCDLSVCLRNRSDCERECLQQRSAFPLEGPEAIVTNLKNRISFGPMLKEVKNSTFLEEIDPSELDLALVIVSLVVGSSLVTVMLLLVWLAYRRRAIWLLPSVAPPRACCGCMRPRGDLILP